MWAQMKYVYTVPSKLHRIKSSRGSKSAGGKGQKCLCRKHLGTFPDESTSLQVMQEAHVSDRIGNLTSSEFS